MYLPHTNSGNQLGVYGLENGPCASNKSFRWYPVTGDLIEGLSILSFVTGDGNGLLRQLLSDDFSFYRVPNFSQIA